MPLCKTGQLSEKYIRSRDTDVLRRQRPENGEADTVYTGTPGKSARLSEDNGNSMMQRAVLECSTNHVAKLDNFSMDMSGKIVFVLHELGDFNSYGEVRAGAEHDEFYVDDEALQKMIIEIFYKEAD